MKQLKFTTVFIIVQFLFLTNMLSQTQSNRFIIGNFDYSVISTSIDAMVWRYKKMQEYNINCAMMPFKLHKLNSTSDTSNYFQWVSSTPPPSKEFLDSAYTHGIKVIPYVPENSVISDRNGYLPYDNTKAQQGLAYWGNHPALGGFYIKDELFSRDDINYVKPHAQAIRAFKPDLLRFAIIPPVCNV